MLKRFRKNSRLGLENDLRKDSIHDVPGKRLHSIYYGA